MPIPTANAKLCCNISNGIMNALLLLYVWIMWRIVLIGCQFTRSCMIGVIYYSLFQPRKYDTAVLKSPGIKSLNKTSATLSNTLKSHLPFMNAERESKFPFPKPSTTVSYQLLRDWSVCISCCHLIGCGCFCSRMMKTVAALTHLYLRHQPLPALL